MCFPILAMKIIGLTKVAHGDNSQAKSYGLYYGVGVIVTFASLGALLFVLKATGEWNWLGLSITKPNFLSFDCTFDLCNGFELTWTF